MLSLQTWMWTEHWIILDLLMDMRVDDGSDLKTYLLMRW